MTTSTHFFAIVIIIFHLGNSIENIWPTGNDVTCSGSDECVIQCDNFASCSGTSGDPGITITCPSSGHPCKLVCQADACQHTTLICPTDNSLCEVYCDGSGACEVANFQWGPSYNNILECNAQYACIAVEWPIPDPFIPLDIGCGFRTACDSGTLHCPTDAICTVHCDGIEACQDAVIYWPKDRNAAANSNLICSGTNACTNTTPQPINPPSSQDYTLVCNSESQCENWVINCPINGGCFITCNAISACRDMEINWVKTQNHWIDCQPFTEVCFGVHLSWYDQNTPLNLDCKATNACSYAVIDCPTDANCDIDCQFNSACTGIEINGPINYALNIQCNQQNACQYGNIHAENTASFYMDGCNIGSRGCTSMNIWVSWNNGGIFNGMNNAFSGVDNDMHLYAQNGFNDIIFTG
eukprot:30199_1